MAKQNKNSQRWKVGNKFATFKDFIKTNGTDSVIYEKLSTHEKKVINGIEAAGKRVKLDNKYVSKEVAYRIKKDYESSENIKAKHPDFKEYLKSGSKVLKQMYVNNIVNYNYSLNSIKNKINKFENVYVNGNLVTNAEAQEYINGFNVFKQEGTTIDGNIPVKINPATKSIYLELPTPEELEEMQDLDEDELEEALEKYGIKLYKSAEKTPEQERAAKDRNNERARERRAAKKNNIRRD
jgi:hypothetical protein